MQSANILSRISMLNPFSAKQLEGQKFAKSKNLNARSLLLNSNSKLNNAASNFNLNNRKSSVKAASGVQNGHLYIRVDEEVDEALAEENMKEQQRASVVLEQTSDCTYVGASPEHRKKLQSSVIPENGVTQQCD